MDTEPLYRPYIDRKYSEFSQRLTKHRDRPYLGVRIPVLRRLAGEIESADFPVVYHEDVLLRGFWIARQRIPFSEKRKLLEDHLQYLETWDEADTLASSLHPGKKELDEAYDFFTSLLEEERVMPRRLGIVTLMSQRAKYPEKRDEIIRNICRADSDEYYISMAAAWALSFFFIDDNSAADYLSSVSAITRKRAEQKIRDSRRTGKGKHNK